MTLINTVHHHYILYKTQGYISQFITNDAKARKKKFLGEFHTFPDGTMAVGRLDEKSEGLLLLTTDGKSSFHITSNKVEKEYYVLVDGLISSEAIKKIEEGVEIGIEGKKYLTKPCKANIIAPPHLPKPQMRIRDGRHGPTSWISVCISEGKFRQVRKMTAAVGFPTLRLVRVRIGKFYIDQLQPGEVKELESLM